MDGQVTRLICCADVGVRYIVGIPWGRRRGRMWRYQKDMNYQAATEVAIGSRTRRELPPLALAFVSPFLKLAIWSNVAGD